MRSTPQTLIRWTLSLLLACFAIHTCHAQYVIDSLNGEVTQHEVDTFISNVTAIPIPTIEDPGTSHNYLADGPGGVTLEAINYMYVITGDIPSLSAEHAQLLNLAIKWNDVWLTHRNDMPAGEHRVMWTGKVEPVWPPNCGTCSNPTYYESEDGDTIAHMGYTTLNILNTPSIWNNTVPDGDPNHFGATYLARAKTYVSMLEFSMSNSFTPYFIDPNTLLIRRPSTSLGYQSGFHNVNAWNVMMMLIGAYQRLAQCHAILGDNPSLATMYTGIVKNTTDLFVKNGLPYSSPDGTTVYNWSYGNFGDVHAGTTGEDVGHGQYDMWGLTRAYQSGYTDATAQQMKTYADTVVHEIADGTNLYFARVDRSGGATQNNLLPGWFFLTPYNTAIYKPVANANIAAGKQQGSTIITAGILWMKHWISVHSSPPDFSITAGPASQTVIAGNGTSYTATVAPINGFNGTVSLGVSGVPSGAACSGPAISGGSGSSTVSCSTTISTAPGTYTLTITGTSGSLSHTATVSLTVMPEPPPAFSVSVSPTSQTVTAGGSTSYTATVTPSNGFNGTVNFTVSGVPSGASCSAPAISGGSGSSTVSCSTTSAVTPATYTLTIIGTSGSQSHSATVNLTVTSPNVCSTATATGTWNDTAFPSHSGSFTATFDATPSIGTQSSAVGISKGAQTAFTGFANIVAFATTGIIQARNGGSYFNSTIHYSGGVSYHFRLAINVTAHTYSIFVTPAGGSEQTIGTNFAFRNEQNTVTSLDHWGSEVSATSSGTLQVCNFAAQ
ncbi:MAG TPA: hypothetical protein VFA71_03600 [Terriglobales bacterium]|nr:hypothetical protein [Terriglobales bacterium]